ncbi:MAG: SIS domain-containing protein [Erysipelotrichaceae bacterium]|nr:SIS domain-containing protein [Erysipelotrichaceae bacterium]
METKKYTMRDYIASCPEIMRDNIKKSEELTKALVDEYVDGGYKNVWIVACGSSSNGSYCGRMYVKHHLKCECKVVNPFTFITAENDIGPEDMVVAVSQSGYSTNALEALDVIKSKGRKTIGLTGDVNSDFKEKCDVLVNWGVGTETVAYVTRGVTTLALFFMLFALEAAKKKGYESEEEYSKNKAQLLKACDINEEVQKNWTEFMKKHYKRLSSMTNAYMCSVGANMGTAYEGALKFGETISIPTAAYEAEEYIHGPNIQLTPKYSVFVIDGGIGSGRLKNIYEGTRIVTDNAFLITNTEYEGDENIFYVKADVDEDVTPICYLPIFQITAADITDDLNRWIKHPLQEKMDKYVSAKSENYDKSPFALDTPKRHEK